MFTSRHRSATIMWSLAFSGCQSGRNGESPPSQLLLSDLLPSGWTAASTESADCTPLRPTVQDILQQLYPSASPPQPAEGKPSDSPVYCGKTKVFMANSMVSMGGPRTISWAVGGSFQALRPGVMLSDFEILFTSIVSSHLS